MSELTCGVVAGCVLATLSPITLDGRPLSPIVEVWTIQEPTAPAAVAEVEPDAPTDLSRQIVIGAIAGAGLGCLFGAAASVMTTDITASGSCGLNAIVFGGITAGTIAVVHWMKNAPPWRHTTAGHEPIRSASAHYGVEVERWLIGSL